MLKLTKKLLTIFSIISTVIPILLLIGTLFGLVTFDGVFLKLMLTFVTLAVAGGFAINALNIIRKNKTISFISLTLLLISSILLVVMFWSNFSTPEIYNDLTVVISMATIFFCIIISMHLKLSKRYLALQIITYILVVAIDIILTLNIFGVNIFAINGMIQTFITLCLITFALLLITGILGKKSADNDTVDNDKYIKITIEEYNELKERIKYLENELENVKKVD